MTVELGAKALESILDDADFWSRQRRRMLRAVRGQMWSIFLQGSKFARGLDVEGYEPAAFGRRDFLDPDPAELTNEMGQVFRNYLDDWWSGIEATTREQMRGAIIRSYQDGTGVAQVIRDIEPLFGPERARRIGVTETTRLFGRGAQATYRASGLLEWQWMTVEDARVCPICDALSGNVYPLDLDFDPAHVSCRCFPSPVA